MPFAIRIMPRIDCEGELSYRAALFSTRCDSQGLEIWQLIHWLGVRYDGLQTASRFAEAISKMMNVPVFNEINTGLPVLSAQRAGCVGIVRDTDTTSDSLASLDDQLKRRGAE